MSEWWNRSKKRIPYTDKDFIKIFDFFVMNCPVQFKNGKRVSARAITFEDAGIYDVKLTSLLKKMKGKLGENSIYHIADKDSSVELMEEQYEKAGYTEIVVYKESRDLFATRSIFYYVRNAFAHGTFSIVVDKSGSKLYVFENKSGGIIKARFILKEKTLLSWSKLTRKCLKGT